MGKKSHGGLRFFKPAAKAARPAQQAERIVAVERLSAEGRGLGFVDGKPVFVAGVLPGVLAASMYICTVAIIGFVRPDFLPRTPRHSWKERLSSVRDVWATMLLFVFVIAATALFGPIAACLVELFPTRIRYTAMSLPYHIGTGWIGGFVPFTAFAIVAAVGNIYSGLWYPFAFTALSVVTCLLFLPETKGRSLDI